MIAVGDILGTIGGYLLDGRAGFFSTVLGLVGGMLGLGLYRLLEAIGSEG